MTNGTDDQSSTPSAAVYGDELRAWDEERIAQRERMESEIFETYNKMMEKVPDPASRNEVLAWCMERIDIPAAKPQPYGRVKIADLKQWYVADDDRRMKELDSSLRARAAKFLTTREGDVH
jgi:hypothetical protein